MVQLTHKRDKGSCRDLLMMAPRNKYTNGSSNNNNNSNNHNGINNHSSNNNNIDNNQHDTTGKAAFKPQVRKNQCFKKK